MGRNYNAVATAAVEVVPADDVGGDVVITPLPALPVEGTAADGGGAGELTAEEEAARLKELNAALEMELAGTREQVAVLTALVDQLTIAAKTVVGDAQDQESLEPAAAAEERETGAAQEEAAAAAASKKEPEKEEIKKSDELRAEIGVGEPEKKQPEKKKVKKKAPARRVQTHKAEKISTAATATAPADDQGGDACEAGRGAGRSGRVKKANTMYPSDTWAR